MAAETGTCVAPYTHNTGCIPEVSILSNKLLDFLQSRRQPCVIRGAGVDLDIVKGCNNKSQSDNDSKGGVQWLAEQAGSSIFRVFVSGPVQDESAKNKSIGNNNTNAPSTFTLDGTNHPDTILTTSMSIDMTLTDMMNNQNWKSRYMVEDDLPQGPLHTIIPPRPPSPLLRAFVHDDGGDSNSSDSDPVVVAKQRQLFVSFGQCQTQLHRDCFDNVYVCACGERHWTITAPDDKLAREAGSVSASMSAPSSANEAHPATAGGPDFISATLHAGDAIFVPAKFWHSVRSDQGESIALNWYYEPFVTESNIVDTTGSTTS